VPHWALVNRLQNGVFLQPERIGNELRAAAHDPALPRRHEAMAPRFGSSISSLCEKVVLSTVKSLIFNAATPVKVAFSHRLFPG
jgi:hypothetical protein